MSESLKRILSTIEEAITYAEAQDVAYTRHYSMLCRKRRILKRTIRIFEKMERRF